MSLKKAKEGSVTILAASSGTVTVLEDEEGIRLGITRGYHVHEPPDVEVLLTSGQRKNLRELLAVKPKKPYLARDQRCHHCEATYTTVWHKCSCGDIYCDNCFNREADVCVECYDGVDDDIEDDEVTQCRCGIHFENSVKHECEECEDIVCTGCWSRKAKMCRECDENRRHGGGK